MKATEGRYIGGVRDTSAPTGVQVILLNSIIHLNDEERIMFWRADHEEGYISLPMRVRPEPSRAMACERRRSELP